MHNLATGKQLKDIKLPDAGSVEMLLDADNRKAYATQMETARVFELDMDQLEILRTFHTGSNFTKVPVFSPDKKKLYASNWKGHDVVEIDLVSGKRVRSMRTVHTPRGLYVTPDGAHLYVAGYGGSGLARITLATGRSERVARGRALRHIVPSPEHDRLYVSDMAAHAIFTYDLKTGAWDKLADTMLHPNTIDLTPDGQVLLVSNRGRNGPGGYLTVGKQRGSVLAIDTADGRVLDAIAGGMQCTALDVSDDGSLLVFSDFRDDALRVYRIPDTQTLRAAKGGRWAHHQQDVLDLSYREP